MKFFHFLLAGIILGAESRSLSPSSFEEALQWSPDIEMFPAEKSFSFPDEKFETLMNEFAEKPSVDGIIDGKDSETQWLNHLKSMLNDTPRGQDNPEPTTTKSLKIFQSPNILTDLIDSVDELEFDYPDGRDDERHVKSRYEDFSAMFPLIQEEPQTSETKSSEGTKGKNDVAVLDSILLDFQSQINRMQKYLRKLCRTRKSTSVVQKTFGVDQDWSISPDLSEQKKTSL